ncbi:hypothetical protein NMY22_g2875 [Coprinellus aureogranulatus]|nr:hypothetical protein NMY22_g2875 [Coprinellus aureogranulatus]
MVDAKNLLPLLRIGVFGSVCVLSLIVFALSAHIISVTSTARYGYYFTFTALGLATALLTLISLPAIYVISIKRRGAFTSYIGVEVGWCWFLWIMWVATASHTVGFGVNFCSGGLCSEAQVIEAFSFLNWLAMMGYTITLLAFAIMLHMRGHTNVWTAEVTTFDWNAPNVKFAQHNHPGGVVQDKYVAGGMVPQQQVIYPQQGQYPPQNTGGFASPQTTGQTVFVGTPTGGVPNAPQV